MSNHIFLVGASRGVGKEIAKFLTAQNTKVTALLRTDTARADIEGMGAQVVSGDALNSADIESAMSTAEPIDAVISTIGGLPGESVRPDYLGNKNLIDAAVKAGVKKFILVTSIGTGNSVDALPPQALETLKPVLIEKDKAEQYLMQSGLNYTIVRPGGLKSEAATGNGVLTEDTSVVGSIHRADVAQQVCRCLDWEKANNKVLSAVDKNMLFGQAPFEEFS
ncbi:MAG: SDR family oxidoreductase [Scytonematopsis contorta HA4267-MV1]|jgi:nucleoside-diphosphate-sugar epimerase|nr:SDR family oxidoreductase [Scytonematopsis contorta HA4267-MV1]